jgi:hypothetical protein
MSGRILRSGVVVLTCATLAPAVAAAQDVTLRLGTPDLARDRVTVTVPVIVSCTPFDASLIHFMSGVEVTVRRAAGQEIARGTAMVTSVLPDLLFPCDGTEYTVPVVVFADPAGPPFHGGPAAFSASAFATAGTPCFPGSTNCFTNLVGKSETHATTLNLR